MARLGADDLLDAAGDQSGLTLARADEIEPIVGLAFSAMVILGVLRFGFLVEDVELDEG
jgi:hypothetical protein